MTMRDGIGGAGLDTISAKDAAVVIDVIDLGVTLGPGDPVLFRVLRRFNVDAVRRTRRRAQETGNALFQSALIALQHVQPTETLLKHRAFERTRTVRVILDDRRLEHLAESGR